jgi:diguanylate cyclase (GGDEF)-like protein/PAS domain S-box-containing protein
MHKQPESNSEKEADNPMTWEPSRVFLRYVLIAILAGLGAYTVAVLNYFPDQPVRLIGPVFLCAVAVVSIFCIWRNLANLVSKVLLLGCWLAAGLTAFLNDGLGSPSMAIFPLAIIFAGWLLSLRAAVLITLLTGLFVIGLAVAETSGVLVLTGHAPTILFVIVELIVITLSLLLIVDVMRSYKARLLEMTAIVDENQARSRELVALNSGMAQSQSKFATAFGSCPVAASIATVDEGRFLEVNQNYERDYGWSAQELLGKTTQDIGLWQDRQAHDDWMRMLVAQGRLVEYETVWTHKNGDLRKVSISCEIIEISSVQCILAYATDITARKMAEEQIQSLAFTDSLTGLPNRRLLFNRLEHGLAAANRHQRKGALLFIDLDNFKTLNDTHGHDQGDILLKQVAQRLLAVVRETDTVARLGGDEFVVMLENLSIIAIEAANEAERVALKLLDALNHEYLLPRVSFISTPSIGVTLFGEEPESMEEPLKRADMAMYQAKAAGRNAVRFFNPEIQAIVNARVEMERDLRIGLTQQQFILLYQPQMTADGRVTGAEVLVRWNHPDRGTVSPAAFIPLAEESGLILPLGDLILDVACAELARWGKDPHKEDLTLSVNVSAKQFQQDDFGAGVLAAVARHGANPQRLKLELTESVMVNDVESIVAKMTSLRDQGVCFSMDDFGTGYSSLSSLKRLPLDQLKIDQSFVRDILIDANDAAIARMVIVLGESLGLEVIAEGVETLEQKEALAGLGCSSYQGYLISRPLTIEGLDQFLSAKVK